MIFETKLFIVSNADKFINESLCTRQGRHDPVSRPVMGRDGTGFSKAHGIFKSLSKMQSRFPDFLQELPLKIMRPLAFFPTHF